MSMELTLSLIANFSVASVMGLASYLFIDALHFRFEVKSFMKAIGFLLLTAGFALRFSSFFLVVNQSMIIWIKFLGFWVLFSGFIYDSHSKFQLLTIILILSTFFSKNHLLLSIEAFLITIVILQLAYYKKHKDLIPLITAFFLFTTAELFKYLNNFKEFGNIYNASMILYILASGFIFYWILPYLRIRFNLKQNRID